MMEVCKKQELLNLESETGLERIEVGTVSWRPRGHRDRSDGGAARGGRWRDSPTVLTAPLLTLS